jgi:gluconate:H+ symporter, GntP family
MAPLLIAGVAIVFVIVAIAMARVHAFFALVLAGILVAVLGVATGTLEVGYAASIEIVMTELGATAGRIAWIIVAAAVIGACLTESGAAERIVDAMLATFGQKRAGLALLTAGFILSIPVFFDTVFILLLPLARALARKTGGHYLYYLLAICAGGVIAHSNVPPTPGPLILAEMLQIDLALAIGAGCAVGVPVALFSLVLARWLGRRVVLENPPEAAGATDQRTRPLPSLTLSLLPIVTPLALIAAAAIVGTEAGGPWLALAGNKNMALLIALVLAVALVLRAGGRHWRDLSGLMGEALQAAGVIVLITSAGGAFGAMIKLIGIGDAVEQLTEGAGVNAVLLAWVIAVVVRVAQGSATVAMMTAGAIMMSLGPETLRGTHPIYLYLAIGYGSFCCSWMNDSGFWLVSRLGGLTEREALRSWTVLLSAVSVAGLIVTWVASRVIPLG